MSNHIRGRKLRPLFIVPVVLTAALITSGCGAGEPAAGPEGTGAPAEGLEPQFGGDLRVTFSDDDGCRDSNQSSRHESRIISRQIVDNLTDQDPVTGEIKPWIAESWEISPDASEYTFFLQEGVTFSDGAPFDAEAVKTAFDGIVELGARSVLGYSYLASNYVETEVIDDRTVTVRFDRPNVQFLQATSSPTLGILSPASYEKTPEERCAGDFAGSGAFVLDSYVPNTSVKLVKRDDYAWNSSVYEHTGPAYVDTITFDFISEVGVRVGEFVQGRTHIDNARRPSSTQTQYSDAEFAQIAATGATAVRRGIPGVSILAPNVTRFPFDNPVVREAFQHALDREEYAIVLFDKEKKPAEGVLAAATPGYVAYPRETSFDLDRVDALLTGDGWAKNAEGIWEKDGRPLVVYQNATSTGADGDLLQAQLKAAGFDLQRRIITQAQSTELSQAGDWDLTGAVVTRADADLIRNYYDIAVGHVIAKFSVPEQTQSVLRELFDRSLAAVDTEERNGVFTEIQDLLIAENIVFPQNDRELTAAYQPSVHGFEWTAESFFHLHGVWIDESAR